MDFFERAQVVCVLVRTLGELARQRCQPTKDVRPREACRVMRRVRRRMRIAGLCLIVASTAALADHPPHQAQDAAIADTATTALSLARGLTEANPVGAVGAVAAKLITGGLIQELDEEEQAFASHSVSALWGGAAANNFCWLLGAGPMCFAAGVARGLQLWSESREERDFWDMCKLQRALQPGMACDFIPSVTDASGKRPTMPLNVLADLRNERRFMRLCEKLRKASPEISCQWTSARAH